MCFVCPIVVLFLFCTAPQATAAKPSIAATSTPKNCFISQVALCARPHYTLAQTAPQLYLKTKKRKALHVSFRLSAGFSPHKNKKSEILSNLAFCASSGARSTLRALRIFFVVYTPYPPKRGQAGFEPCLKTKRGKPFGFPPLVLPQGLEPWTPTLRVSCSTS